VTSDLRYLSDTNVNTTRPWKRSTAEIKGPGLAVLVGAVDAIVFLKSVLREAIESECGCGAFETRGRDTPGAVGAAPAGEIIAVDPDQAFVHTSLPFACVWDWG
jgi:hypothetical protein